MYEELMDKVKTDLKLLKLLKVYQNVYNILKSSNRPFLQFIEKYLSITSTI